MNTQNHPDTTKLKDQIAVMQAAMEGKKIQCRIRCGLDNEWVDAPTPEWSWDGVDYRIAPSPISPGHNPDKLTEEQVGVADGWRLLSEEEVAAGHKPNFGVSGGFSDTQYWRRGNWSETAYWLATEGSGRRCTLRTLRTKRPPGYFLSKPKRRVPWSCPEDVPGPVCWVRRDVWLSGECGMIIGILADGVWVGGGRDIETRFRDWEWFSREKVTFSTDRKTWLPCEKEVEG